MATAENVSVDERDTQPPRPERDILSDLDQLTQEPGFIYTPCVMVAQALLMSPDEVADINWYDRPNRQELSLLLGFLVKHQLRLDEFPSEETVEKQKTMAIELLNELHQACGFPQLPEAEATDSDEDKFRKIFDAYNEWIESGIGMREPIFYGGDGAYPFQCLEMASERYALDEDWIQSNVGIGFEEIREIANGLEHLFIKRIQNIDFGSTHDQNCFAILSSMAFQPSDLPQINRHAMECFLHWFSLKPGEVNQNFNSIGDYNKIHSHPVITLEDGRYWVPILSNLAESIYESPYYWMEKDEEYKDTASKNRGATAEIITRDLLIPAFGSNRVHRGVKVRRGKTDITDLDTLAISGNKALIVQCKSKKLTITARSGDGPTIRTDFKKAIQDAYDQGIAGRKALLEGDCELIGEDGVPINLPSQVDEVYILCITGDHYPAVISQARTHLKIQDGDPHPIMMSIFDLDVVSYYLRDRFELLYYLRQRSNHTEYFLADSEMALLGFHLNKKLFPEEDYTLEPLDPSYAQLIDANFQVARGGWPGDGAAGRLFHTWKNETFDQLVNDIKLAANQPSRQKVAAEDLLFFLYDLAGEAADNLVNLVKLRKRATLLDGKMHDARVPIPRHKKGVTFVSFPEPTGPMELDIFSQRCLAIALAHKYISEADEWIALASFAGSPVEFDIFGYIREPWQQDSEMDKAVQSHLNPGKAINTSGKKLGRNQRCPCGSGKKFKRCHGK